MIREFDVLAGFCLISLVTVPKIPSTSTMIFMMISLIASVVGTSVYVSSLRKKPSMRSKISKSVSLLAATSFAACEVRCEKSPGKEIEDDRYQKEDTSTSKDHFRR